MWFSSISAMLSPISAIFMSDISTDTINTIIGAAATVGTAVIGLIGTVIVQRTIQRKKRHFSERHSGKGKASEKLDYAEFHRENLLADPHITSLPTLDPRWISVGFDKLYIELHLYAENSLNHEIDTTPAFDPNKLIQASQEQLEKSAGCAKLPEDAISEVPNKRCIILGDPGAGKTSLLKYLALQSARGKLKKLPDLPIYIELYEFAASEMSSLIDYLSSKWVKDYIAPPTGDINLIIKAKDEILSFLTERLEQGQILLLLDGLGETVVGKTPKKADETHNRVIQAIDRITKKYYRTPIVITARKAEHPQRTGLDGFTILDVLDFRPTDIKRFLVKWYGNYGDSLVQELADELYSILNTEDRIHALARNPLLLSIIAIVYKDLGGLPEGRARIYAECVRVLLEKWNAKTRKYRPNLFKPHHKERLLEDIAWHFHRQGRGNFEEEALLNTIAKSLPNINFRAEQSEQILKAIAVENGLLKEQAHKLYSFIHLTLQGYFTARRIADDSEQLNILLSHCYEPWWEEVLLLYAGTVSNASPLVQKLLESDSLSSSQQNLFFPHLILAGRCIAEDPKSLQLHLRQQTILELERTLQSTPYTLTRQQIVEVLIDIGRTEPNGQIDEKLLGLLSDENISKDIRETIIFSLGKAGRTDLAEKLLPKINAPDIQKSIRKSIVQIFSLLGDSSIADSLSNLLVNRMVEDEIGESIADTLGKLGADGKLDQEGLAVWNMLQILPNQEISQSVRLHVADALGRTGLPYLAPDLFEILTRLKTGNDAAIDVCMHIADALGALGTPHKVDELLKMLSARDIPSRLHIRIINAMGFLGKTCNSIQLQNILFRLRLILCDASVDVDVRGHAAIALGRLGEQFTEDKFKDLLTKPNIHAFIRKSMIIALGETKNQTYISVLLGLLENDKEELELRIFVADALGSIGESEYPPQLSRNLQAQLLFRLQNLLSQPSLDSSIAGSIAGSLSKIGERSIGASLLPLLSRDKLNLHTRGHIALALTRLGEQSAVPQIVEYLAYNGLEPYIGWLIAKGIESAGISPRDKRQVVSRLVSFLKKETNIDRDVRRHIAHTLEQLAEDEKTVYELSEQLLKSDISDDIHRALWTISRRAKMSIFIAETPDGNQIEAIPWQAYE